MPRVPPKPPVYRRKRVYNPNTRGAVPYGYDPWRYGWKKTSPDGLYNDFTAPPSNLYDHANVAPRPPPLPRDPGPGSAAIIRQIRATAANQARADRRAFEDALQPIRMAVQDIRSRLGNQLMGLAPVKGEEPEDLFAPHLFREPRVVYVDQKPKMKNEGKSKGRGKHSRKTDATTVAEGAAFAEDKGGPSSPSHLQPTASSNAKRRQKHKKTTT